MTDKATVLNEPLLPVAQHVLPWQQRTVTTAWTHHQQVRWWGWPCPSVRRTCVCGRAVSSACSAWCCGNPRPGLRWWSGGALLHLSSPSSQRGERSEPCYVSGDSSLSHPDRRRISGVCCLSGWMGCSRTRWETSDERNWSFFAPAGPKWMIKYRSWSPLEQETYNAVGNNPDLHLNQFQIINKAKLKNPRLDRTF